MLKKMGRKYENYNRRKSEKILLPYEEIVVLGTHNPFNKKIYLHCEIK